MKISACWIVKNEAKNIAVSIASVRDCAQELIVVDTGSTDDTVRIAGEFGAKVELFEWVNDFSAARNYALSLATGDYVIFIDADEYFEPALQKADRGIITDSFKDPNVDALLVPRFEIIPDTKIKTEAIPHGRIFRRSAIHWEYRIHEMAKLNSGGFPHAVVLNDHRLMHTVYSGELNTQKFNRNIEILELEQPELYDDFGSFNNRVYLMWEYMGINNYDKAYENCRYLLAHYEQWGVVCKVFLFNFIRYIYAMIRLATVRRFQFSHTEVYERLFKVIKDNYPGSREAALTDLHYQMVFDYQEDRFLRELDLAEKHTKNLPPAAITESRETEAAIYCLGALTAYRRKDAKKSHRWAKIALRIDPELNAELLQAMMDGTFVEEPDHKMKISACWIVKDEAKNIAASILSVKDCAQELIVVDTGSTDDTARVAQECGARVEHFEWMGDFSTARNHALSLAAGEYVIFIDADEYFEPALQTADRGAILDAFEKTGSDVLMIPRVETDISAGRVMEIEPYSRILRRAVIRYENKIHELATSKDGGIPRVYVLNEYRIIHTGYSADRITGKLLRNIELLEAEQQELHDELRLFSNKSYLMREYMSIHNYEKAFENCRYLLDHHEQWESVCRIFSVNHVQRFYVAINLAAIKRFQFSRKEIHRKLIQEIKKNYPGSREARLADLYYQMIFDYREDRFLRELFVAEKHTENMPSCASIGSRHAEAAIYGRGALAAYARGEMESARRWAETALQIEPEHNADILRAVLDKKPVPGANPEIQEHILRGSYEDAFDLIIGHLDGGSLDHTLLESLLVVAEKAEGELAARARGRFETGMTLLDEAIELSDMVNTGYVSEEEVEKQKGGLGALTYDLFSAAYESDKNRPVTPDILTLHGLAAPVYKKSGLPVTAMHSYILLLSKGVEPEKNRRALIRLFHEQGNNKMAERLEQRQEVQ